MKKLPLKIEVPYKYDQPYNPPERDGRQRSVATRMFISDPGSEFFPSRIRIKELKYFELFIQDADSGPGSGPFTHPGSRNQGSKRQRIPDPDPQHCDKASIFQRYFDSASLNSTPTSGQTALLLSSSLQPMRTASKNKCLVV
jgi:hypothetical protein